MEKGFDIADSIADLIGGDATPEQLRRLDLWLEESEDNRRLFESLMDEDSLTRRADALGRDGLEEAFARVRKGKGRKVRRVRLQKAVVAASLLLLIVGSGLFIGRRGSTDLPASGDLISANHKRALITLTSGEQILLDGRDTLLSDDLMTIRIAGDGSVVYENAQAGDEAADPGMWYNTMETGMGMEYQLTLADGTKVWMNVESKLRYPVKFTGDTRTVELTGEAYFDVRHDATMPFIVKTPRAEVNVLGTEFCVRDYSDESYRATLVQGSVAVKDHDERLHVIVPGQQVCIGADGVEVLDVETIRFTSWKDGYFAFHQATVEEIMRTLSRWYDIDYVFANGNAAGTRLTARIRKYEDLDTVLDILSRTGDVDFSHSGREVTIK